MTIKPLLKIRRSKNYRFWTCESPYTAIICEAFDAKTAFEDWERVNKKTLVKLNELNTWKTHYANTAKNGISLG